MRLAAALVLFSTLVLGQGVNSYQASLFITDPQIGQAWQWQSAQPIGVPGPHFYPVTTPLAGALEFRIIGNWLNVYEVWGSYGSPVPATIHPEINLDLDALVLPQPLIYGRLASGVYYVPNSLFQGITAFGIPYSASESFHLTLQTAVYSPNSFLGFRWSAATEVLR